MAKRKKKKTKARKKTKKAKKKTTKSKKKTRKATRRPKARKTKKRAKRKPNKAFMKPMTPSSALAAIIGSKALPRTQVTKKIWQYIKKHKLQDKTRRIMINADEKLRQVLGGKKKVSMFEMTKWVNKHLKG